MNQTETSFRTPSTSERNFAQSTDNPGYFDNSGGYQIMQQQHQQLKQQSQHLQLKQQPQQQLKQEPHQHLQLKQQSQHLQLKQQPQQLKQEPHQHLQLKQQPQQQPHLQIKQQQHQQLKQQSEQQQHLQLKQQQLLKQQSQLLKQQQQHQQLILQQQHPLLTQQPQQHLLLKQQPQQQQADETRKHISQMQHLVPYSLYSSPGSMLNYGQGPMHGISSPALAKAYSTISSEKSHKFRGEKKPMPDDQKDDKYFERRRRNNEAAKRSRDARKSREDELTLSAVFLEQEQGLLLARLEAVRKENDHLKTLMFLKWQKMLQFNMMQAQQAQNKVQGTVQNSSLDTDPNSVEHQHKA